MSVLRLWLAAQSPVHVAESLLDALIAIHPEHEQHEALLVAGAAAVVLARAARHLPCNSAATSAVRPLGTSQKFAVMVNLLLAQLLQENDTCFARVQTRDL